MPQHYHTVQEAAQELGIGSRRLYQWLRQQRVIDAANLPYRHYIDRGLLAERRGHWVHPTTDRVRYYVRPVITPRGLTWLRNRLQESQSA